MSAVRTYLEEKAETPREWLRREPKTTHPEILEHVREALAEGLHRDDEVERFVNERVGDLPAHQPHHTDGRDPLVKQLGSEVYLARGILRDEEAKAEEDAALAAGFARIEDVALEHGGRYVVRFGTVYVGRDVAQYGEPRQVRAVKSGERFVLLPKGARTNGLAASGPALVKAA